MLIQNIGLHSSLFTGHISSYFEHIHKDPAGLKVYNVYSIKCLHIVMVCKNLAGANLYSLTPTW